MTHEKWKSLSVKEKYEAVTKWAATGNKKELQKFECIFSWQDDFGLFLDYETFDIAVEENDFLKALFRFRGGGGAYKDNYWWDHDIWVDLFTFIAGNKKYHDIVLFKDGVDTCPENAVGESVIGFYVLEEPSPDYKFEEEPSSKNTLVDSDKPFKILTDYRVAYVIKPSVDLLVRKFLFLLNQGQHEDYSPEFFKYASTYKMQIQVKVGEEILGKRKLTPKTERSAGI